MSNNFKFNLFPKLIIFFLFSCNGNHETNTYKSTTDTIQITPPVDNNTQFHSDTILNNNNVTENTTTRIVPDDELNYKSKDNLAILEEKIIFDANFNPTLYIELENNMNTGIIAVEIVIDPNETDKEECEKIILKRKLSIPPAKTVKFKERIHYKVGKGCLKIEDAHIYLGDFVLIGGKKINNSYDERIEDILKRLKTTPISPLEKTNRKNPLY